jgi:hypothetical protein
MKPATPRRGSLAALGGVTVVACAVFALAFLTKPSADVLIPRAAEIVTGGNHGTASNEADDALPNLIVVSPVRSVDVLVQPDAGEQTSTPPGSRQTATVGRGANTSPQGPTASPSRAGGSGSRSSPPEDDPSWSRSPSWHPSPTPTPSPNPTQTDDDFETGNGLTGGP